QAKKSDWRKKHNDFIEAIRQAKMVQQHLAKGGKVSDLPPLHLLTHPTTFLAPTVDESSARVQPRGTFQNVRTLCPIRRTPFHPEGSNNLIPKLADIIIRLPQNF
ncbi:hypothetical protein TNCT_529751, partial [Trichonephila clavata]